MQAAGLRVTHFPIQALTCFHEIKSGVLDLGLMRWHSGLGVCSFVQTTVVLLQVGDGWALPG